MMSDKWCFSWQVMEVWKNLGSVKRKNSGFRILISGSIEAQQNQVEQILVVYDACHSGSFLPFLIPSSRQDSVCCYQRPSRRGCTDGKFWKLSPSPTISWSRIRNGHTFYDSFLSAKKSLGIGYQERQNAQLDGNGNGIGNEREDKELAREARLGLELQLAGEIPVVGNVFVYPQTVSVGDSVTICAKNVDALEGVARVWAVITPPWDAASPDGTVTDLPIVDLAGGNGSYEGVFDGFVARGEVQYCRLCDRQAGVHLHTRKNNRYSH